MSRTKKFTPEEFVRAWMSLSRADDVAQALGCNAVDARSYANKLRRRGVKLPSRYNATEIDVAALNLLIETKP